MRHIAKYWYIYLLLALAIVAYFWWDTLFPPKVDSGVDMPILPSGGVAKKGDKRTSAVKAGGLATVQNGTVAVGGAALFAKADSKGENIRTITNNTTFGTGTGSDVWDGTYWLTEVIPSVDELKIYPTVYAAARRLYPS